MVKRLYLVCHGSHDHGSDILTSDGMAQMQRAAATLRQCGSLPDAIIACQDHPRTRYSATALARTLGIDRPIETISCFSHEAIASGVFRNGNTTVALLAHNETCQDFPEVVGRTIGVPSMRGFETNPGGVLAIDLERGTVEHLIP